MLLLFSFLLFFFCPCFVRSRFANVEVHGKNVGSCSQGIFACMCEGCLAARGACFFFFNFARREQESRGKNEETGFCNATRKREREARREWMSSGHNRAKIPIGSLATRVAERASAVLAAFAFVSGTRFEPCVWRSLRANSSRSFSIGRFLKRNFGHAKCCVAVLLLLLPKIFLQRCTHLPQHPSISSFPTPFFIGVTGIATTAPRRSRPHARKNPHVRTSTHNNQNTMHIGSDRTARENRQGKVEAACQWWLPVSATGKTLAHTDVNSKTQRSTQQAFPTRSLRSSGEIYVHNPTSLLPLSFSGFLVMLLRPDL